MSMRTTDQYDCDVCNRHFKRRELLATHEKSQSHLDRQIAVAAQVERLRQRSAATAASRPASTLPPATRQQREPVSPLRSPGESQELHLESTSQLQPDAGANGEHEARRLTVPPLGAALWSDTVAVSQHANIKRLIYKGPRKTLPVPPSLPWFTHKT